jgi:hypothetical protein
MLYLLLIVVFSKMSKKWWPFLLIGYCEITLIPCCIVSTHCLFIVSASIAGGNNHRGSEVSVLWSQR